jgi:hypothetical protein
MITLKYFHKYRLMGHNCKNRLEVKNFKKDMQCTAY